MIRRQIGKGMNQKFCDRATPSINCGSRCRFKVKRHSRSRELGLQTFNEFFLQDIILCCGTGQ